MLYPLSYGRVRPLYGAPAHRRTLAGVTKLYSNDEITIVWQPHLCVHSGICVRGLGAVFKPLRRPWIELHHADTAAIVAQVERCPSGALSWRKHGDAPTADDATDRGEGA